MLARQPAPWGQLPGHNLPTQLVSNLEVERAVALAIQSLGQPASPSCQPVNERTYNLSPRLNHSRCFPLVATVEEFRQFGGQKQAWS
jgi:hypothetical protein